MAPAAETRGLQFMAQSSAGPCIRNWNCIGNVRSEARSDTGDNKSGAAQASAIANDMDRLILPLSRHVALLIAWSTTFWLGLAAPEYPRRLYVLVHLRDSGLV